MRKMSAREASTHHSSTEPVATKIVTSGPLSHPRTTVAPPGQPDLGSARQGAPRQPPTHGLTKMTPRSSTDHMSDDATPQPTKMTPDSGVCLHSEGPRSQLTKIVTSGLDIAMTAQLQVDKIVIPQRCRAREWRPRPRMINSAPTRRCAPRTRPAPEPVWRHTGHG